MFFSPLWSVSPQFLASRLAANGRREGAQITIFTASPSSESDEVSSKLHKRVDHFCGQLEKGLFQPVQIVEIESSNNIELVTKLQACDLALFVLCSIESAANSAKVLQCLNALESAGEVLSRTYFGVLAGGPVPAGSGNVGPTVSAALSVFEKCMSLAHFEPVFPNVTTTTAEALRRAMEIIESAILRIARQRTVKRALFPVDSGTTTAESDSCCSDDEIENATGGGCGGVASQHKTKSAGKNTDAPRLSQFVRRKVPMLSDEMRATLGRQGYCIIGSHSGVKLCRWTKHQLRGQGGCYKHTFYGIESMQCMEATPNLACANKCIFCWRHHKNPVGRSWRWDIDAPDLIVEGMIQHHFAMVKEFRGAARVLTDRFTAASARIAHCALSLVGEPIMYPYINKILQLLHAKHISTFLVTNAQFPDQLAALTPVTQLYLSIDAADQESLRKIDKPLFADFWTRFLTAVAALADYPQRTVFRLTLVKSHNMEQAQSIAKLVNLGKPDFIEIKAVTFAGHKKDSGITMQNVPRHAEVIHYAQDIVGCVEGYSLCCEHEHSCCVLIAKNEFFRNGSWNVWIDYPKFFALVERGLPFSSHDYSVPAPAWAIYGNADRGFDPSDERRQKLRKTRGVVGGV